MELYLHQAGRGRDGEAGRLFCFRAQRRFGSHPAVTLSKARRLGVAGLLRLLSSDRLTGQAAWIAVPIAMQQFIRLVQNVIVTKLLAPEMFGLMMLVVTLRVAGELLSDVGIGQSIVRSSRGDERRFLDTAWTLQLIRGALLTLIMIAAAGPIADIYGQPELQPLLMLASAMFLFTGLQSTAMFLIQRHMRLHASAALEIGNALFQSALTILLAVLMPTVWALAWGMVGGSAFACVMTYVIGKGHIPKLTWDKAAVSEIFNFGKWIFFSTIIYFAAMSADRFYFVAVLPLAVAGVYSIARTFSELFEQLGHRACSLLVFPKFAALGDRRAEAADWLRRRRRAVVALVALGMGGAIAVADRLILLLYDDRYHLAAFMLPVMLFGVWFRVLGSFGDAMLMGTGRPAPGAFANGAKFVTMVIGLPLAFEHASLFVALLVLIVAEAARWIFVVPILQREKLMTIGDDLVLTVLVIVTALVAKCAFGWVGLVPTIAQWWELGASIRS